MKTHYFRTWILGWVELACALYSILSLGFHRPDWDMDFLFWATAREYRKRKNK